MESSRKSHAIELSLFMWLNARWHNWKCGYTAYTQLEAAPINHFFTMSFMPQLQPCCSGTQINDPEVSDEGSDQPWDTGLIEPHDLVYYIGLEQAQ